MKKSTWTPEQDALLASIWQTGESLKPYLAAMGDRTYKGAISHAHKVLKLGDRPVSDRGRAAYAWPTLKAELEKAPGTAPELIKRTRLGMAPVCAHLRKANPGPSGLVHICGWRKRSNGGTPTAIYAIGPGENAPMPTPFTSAQKWQIKLSRRGKAKSNPFAAAAGLVEIPSGQRGRVYQQSMSLHDDEEMAA